MLQRGNNSYNIPSNKRYQPPPFRAENLEILYSSRALHREDKVEHELQPFLQRLRLHIDIQTSPKCSFFYSALRIAFCFRSRRLINTRPAHSAVNHPQAAQKRAGWLTGTHSPGEFENNSINCYHISSVGVGGGGNAACFLYWKLQIISPFFSRSVASLASYPHHSRTEIYQSYIEI